MKYKILNQKHPSYCEEEILKKKFLYAGGDLIINNAHLFIQQEIYESPLAYQKRLKSASYKNYLSEIINSYASELFSKTLSIMPATDADNINTKGTNVDLSDTYYLEFYENVDFKGTQLPDFLKQCFIEANIQKSSYIALDFPKIEVQPINIIEEKTLGQSRPYLQHIDYESVIDYDINEQTGKFNWVVLKSEELPRNSFAESRSHKVYTFKVWQKLENKIVYQIYELKKKIDDEPSDEDECILIDQNVTSFSEIPIMKLEMPSEIYINGVVGNLCADYFKRYSALIHAQNRSLYALPVFKQGPEISADGSFSELSQQPYRGEQVSRQMQQRGFAVISHEDDIFFVEPDGKAYNLVHDQLNELADDIRRVSHIMANSLSNSRNANSVSGLSKMIDGREKEQCLLAYGDIVKAFVINLYNLISTTRNDKIDWMIQGLDEFKLNLDKDILLKEATSIQLINIPSKTFQKNYYLQLASNLLESATPQEKLIIKQEICKSIDSGEYDHEIDDMNEKESEENDSSMTPD